MKVKGKRPTIKHFNRVTKDILIKDLTRWVVVNIKLIDKLNWCFFLSSYIRTLYGLLCFQVATIAWFEADSVCGSHSVAIPIVLVFPYLCRFFQCLRQYKDTKERTCLFNGKCMCSNVFTSFSQLIYLCL